MLHYNGLPLYLRVAYIFSILLIICHIVALAALVYWQLVEPTNLTFKYWFKAPLHLAAFDSVTTAVVLGGFFFVAQLIGLFIFTSWIFQQGKKVYYLVFGLVVLGIWTYFMLPGIILLALMLPEVSLHHFGLVSFEDLF